MKKQVKISTTYNEYLNTLSREELLSILDFYNISYRKNSKKEVCINLVIENLDNIVDKSISVFQNDEYINMKYVIKKKGLVEVRLNYLLYDFLNNLSKKHLIIRENEKLFYMPKDVLKIFEKKFNNKSNIEKIKVNTLEYALLLGFIDAYGVVDFDMFYNNYSKIYKYKKDIALDRIKFFSNYFNEFKYFKEKDKNYITSNVINSLKDCKKYLNKKEKYKIYTNEELVDIHTFKYMESYKSYKKLNKFIRNTYEVNKTSTKIVNKWVLIPYLAAYQLDKNVAREKLVELLEQYFEFKNEKQKSKLLTLAENMAMDFPNWRLNGYSEKEHV